MPLGFFQFDNLLRQRVQYFIFSVMELSGLGYQHLEKTHLEKITQQIPADITASGLISLFESQGLEKNAPIILVDEDGKQSSEWTKTLEAEGFINIFWIVGGYKALKTEKDLG